MKMHRVVGAAIVVAGLLAAPSARAQGNFKDCAAQWQAAKAANQTGGKSYREFQKACLARPGSDLAKQAGAADMKSGTSADKPAGATPRKAGKSSAGREAASARQKACGAEWKVDKAAGKVPDGMKWPQYWSACNKRKKGEGA